MDGVLWRPVHPADWLNNRIKYLLHSTMPIFLNSFGAKLIYKCTSQLQINSLYPGTLYINTDIH